MAEKNTSTDGAKPATKKVKALRIVAKRDGFRRAGHEFGSAAKEIPLSSLKKDQVEQLKTDPMLVCVETEIVATGGAAAEEAAE